MGYWCVTKLVGGNVDMTDKIVGCTLMGEDPHRSSLCAASVRMCQASRLHLWRNRVLLSTTSASSHLMV